MRCLAFHNHLFIFSADSQNPSRGVLQDYSRLRITGPCMGRQGSNPRRAAACMRFISSNYGARAPGPFDSRGRGAVGGERRFGLRRVTSGGRRATGRNASDEVRVRDRRHHQLRRTRRVRLRGGDAPREWGGGRPGGRGDVVGERSRRRGSEPPLTPFRGRSGLRSRGRAARRKSFPPPFCFPHPPPPPPPVGVSFRLHWPPWPRWVRG